jgi:lipoprotein Spr
LRCQPLKQYPYMIRFTVDEERRVVTIRVGNFGNMNRYVPIVLLFLTALLVTSCATRRQLPSGNVSKEALSSQFGVKVDSDDNLHLYTYLAGWLGVPYRYGGNNRTGVDCSGLVLNAYQQVYSKKLYRSASEMLYGNCRKIHRGKLREGDLVFFRVGKGRKRTVNHVGIYLKENRFIHASTSAGVIVSSLDEPYYRKTWVAAGRVR